MADNDKSTEPLLTNAARDREQHIKGSVISLFRHCEQNANPVLALSRACSKVGYLARDGVRGDLFYLESALNEHKHALLAQRYQQPEEARKHITERDRHLRSFGAAVRRELTHPSEPLATPELRERIDRNLAAGQWSRARSDLELLSQRPDVGRQLPPLNSYPRSSNLPDDHYGSLQDRIDACNAAAHSIERRPAAAARDGSAHGASLGDRSGIVRPESQRTSMDHPQPVPRGQPPVSLVRNEIERASPTYGVAHSSPPHGVTALAARGSPATRVQLQPSKDRGLDR